MNKWIYRTPYDIPELGATAGDNIVVRPSHPTAPVAVVKRYGRHDLVRLMADEHLERMYLLAGDGPPPRTDPHLELVR